MTSLLKKFVRKTTGSVCKHKKLAEDWSTVREPVIEGVPFYVKYLGSSLVHKASGEESTADAIKTIVAMARSKKLPHVKLTISLRGIHMIDLITEETRLEVSVYRISYCSADATYDRVFAFIATNKNETLECHAFLCPKRKMAQSATLTIAQAFNLAFELWQTSQERKRRRRQMKTCAQMSPSCCRPSCCTVVNCPVEADSSLPSSGRFQDGKCNPSSSIVTCSSSTSCCSASTCCYSRPPVVVQSLKDPMPINEPGSIPTSRQQVPNKPSVSNSSSSSSGYNSSHESRSGPHHEPVLVEPSQKSQIPNEGFKDGVEPRVGRAPLPSPPLSASHNLTNGWKAGEDNVLLIKNQDHDHLLIDLNFSNNFEEAPCNGKEGPRVDPWQPCRSNQNQEETKAGDEISRQNKKEPLDTMDCQQHERGNWVHFGSEESEDMNHSFTELALRQSTHPLIQALPQNAHNLALDAFVSPSHHKRPSIYESPLKTSHLSTPVKLNKTPHQHLVATSNTRVLEDIGYSPKSSQPVLTEHNSELFSSPVPTRRTFATVQNNVSLNGSQSAASTPVMNRRQVMSGMNGLGPPSAIPARLGGHPCQTGPRLMMDKWSAQSSVDLSSSQAFQSSGSIKGGGSPLPMVDLLA
ncbi:uncharacterized protein LOC131880113 [Tigriopus californicus]|uniref:uncharacterized protein LOC131880113 n=1 Tax=Tigriopus californicus TaxID=6832 RepID=UPI0027DA9998|nr:uncharacterized protein LOC131880113 [Tigriopus californicus]